MNKIIEIKDLYKNFFIKGKVFEAVKGINIDIQEGQIFGFLGPNGAGKTTTMRILTTLLKPTSGDICIAGYSLNDNIDQIRHKIGYVSQGGGSDHNLTTLENLVLQARLYGFSKSDAYKRSYYLVKAFEMESFEHKIVKLYSGGQKRRLDLALSMIHHPKVLFLDEPTSGLDPQSRISLWREVRKLKEQGTTIFITTHYLEEADILCDNIAIIDQGEIVATGSPDELKKQVLGDSIKVKLHNHKNIVQQVRELFQSQDYIQSIESNDQELRFYVNSESNEKIFPAVLKTFEKSSIEVEEISLAKPTLDDVFLKKTGRSMVGPKEY